MKKKAGLRRANRGLAAILFAVFFLGLTAMVYADSYEKTLEEQRKLAYGSWHAAVYHGDGAAWEALSAHASVETAAYMDLYGLILDEEGVSAGTAGHGSQALFDSGNLTLLDGRLPEAAEEIAVEAALLNRLGCSYELGQRISLTLSVPDGEDAWTELRGTFTLCGVVKNYTANWKAADGSSLVSVFLSDSFCAGLTPFSRNIFVELEERFSDDAASLSALCPRDGRFLLNDYTYLQYAGENQPETDRLVLQAVILALGAVALSVLFYNDLRRRRDSFVLMRAIGATRGQIALFYFREKAGVMLLSCLSGIAAGIGFPCLVFRAAEGLLQQQAAFLLHWGHVFRTALLYLAGLLAAVLTGLIHLFEIPLRGIPRQQAALKRPPRRKPLRPGNLFAVLRRTDRAGRVLSTLLSFLAVTFVLLSAYQAWACCRSYTRLLQDYPSDYHFGYLQVAWAPENKMTEEEYSQVSSAYGVGEIQRFSVSPYGPIALPDGEDEAYTAVCRQYLSRLVDDPEQLNGILIGISENLQAIYWDEADAPAGRASLEEGEVLLYVPGFWQRDNGSLEIVNLSTDPTAAPLWEEHGISAGDTILWGGEAGVPLTVAGVLSSLDGDFPVALNPARPFALLCTEETYRELTGDDGYSYLLVYGDPGTVQYQTDVELSKIRTSLPFVNDRMDHQEEREQRNLQVMLSLVLSVSGFLLIFLLQSGIQYSTERQELQRYRTLYRIGVGRPALRREQLRRALAESLAACILSAAVLFCYLYGEAAASLRSMADYAPATRWEAFCDAMAQVLFYGHWVFVGLMAFSLFLLHTALLFLQKNRLLSAAARS